jgi:hypothetical protein
LTGERYACQETLTKNLCCGLVLSRNLDKNAFTAETTNIKQGIGSYEKRFGAHEKKNISTNTHNGTSIINFSHTGRQ